MAKTPVRYPWTGVTDANGKATIPIRAQMSHFCSLTFTGKAGGEPIWEIDLDGSPELFGKGSRVVLGPMSTRPGQVITVIIATDLPNDPLIGTLSGVQADTPEELAVSPGAPQVAGFSLQTPITALGKFTIAPSGTANQDFILPRGALAVGVQLGPGLATTTQIIIKGNQTLGTYFDNLTPLNQSMTLALVDSADDATVNVQVNSGSGVTITAYVTAILTPEAVASLANNQAFVQLVDASGNSISSDASNVLVGGIHNNLDVSLQLSKPALWQAATKVARFRVSPAAGADFTIITGVGGESIYLFDGLINSNSNAAWEATMWDGASSGAIPLAEVFDDYVTAAGVGLPIPLRWSGYKLAAANGLVGRNDGGQVGQTFYGHVTYAIG